MAILKDINELTYLDRSEPHNPGMKRTQSSLCDATDLGSNRTIVETTWAHKTRSDDKVCLHIYAFCF